MDNQLNNEQKAFINRTKQRVKDVVDPIALEVLAKMLNKNICIYDVPYIESRVRQIVEEKIGQFEFENELILKERKAILKKAINNAAKKKVELAESEKTDDATGERNKRCEDICQFIAYKIIDDKLVESDEDYLKEAIKQDDHLLAFNRLWSLIDGLFETILFSVDKSYLRAAEKIWGKPKEEITLKEVDGLLKVK